VDADLVPQGILQQAKAAANSLLDVDNVDKFICDLPHDLDGGWPDVDPEDAFVTYVQLGSGTFYGMSAVARGSPKARRIRGVALALILTALSEHSAKLSFQTLTDTGTPPELIAWLQTWVTAYLSERPVVAAEVVAPGPVRLRSRSRSPLSPRRLKRDWRHHS